MGAWLNELVLNELVLYELDSKGLPRGEGIMGRKQGVSDADNTFEVIYGEQMETVRCRGHA